MSDLKEKKIKLIEDAIREFEDKINVLMLCISSLEVEKMKLNMEEKSK